MIKKNNLKQFRSVRKFWNTSPLFTDEVKNNRYFFSEVDNNYINKLFLGIEEIKKKIIFPKNKKKKILDLGCGIGFWTNLFDKLNYKYIYACDISKNSLFIAKQRIYIKKIKFSLGNAEKLKYRNDFFDHVHCYGVIHHTPNIKLAVKEIHRILKISGTACIGVYYKNFLLKNFNILFPFIKIFSYLFLKHTKKRGFFHKVKNLNQLTKLFDGKRNPIGNVYAEDEIKKIILNSEFIINNIHYTYFPSRFFNFNFPFFFRIICTYLFPFMIILHVTKKNYIK
jgi:ubiquinone/menaquinone biosynthesis C-methylase UbiE